MPADEKVSPSSKKFVLSARSILYSVAFFLIFGLTVSNLGLVSQQLHKYGNSYDQYPSREYKHTLGLLLFSSIMSLLFVLTHFWVGAGLSAFVSFLMAVFWGTGAGIIFRVSPFAWYTCDDDPSSFAGQWGVYAGECSRVVSIQGTAWALFGLYILLFIGILAQKLEVKPRPNVSFYGA